MAEGVAANGRLSDIGHHRQPSAEGYDVDRPVCRDRGGAGELHGDGVSDLFSRAADELFGVVDPLRSRVVRHGDVLSGVEHERGVQHVLLVPEHDGATLSGTLTLLDTTGVALSSFALSIPAGQAASANTASLGVMRNRTGTSKFTHDGAPGSIVAEAAIANFSISPAYVQPVKFQAVREAR